MTIKCKAAVIRKNDCEKPFANSKPLSIEEISIDNPRDNEVLVKVKGAGLCHSDLSVINGSRIMPLPLVIGHEGSGEVVETGNAINDIKVGDHVVFQFSPSCGRCKEKRYTRNRAANFGYRSKIWPSAECSPWKIWSNGTIGNCRGR